jgi:hypothetical protein
MGGALSFDYFIGNVYRFGQFGISSSYVDILRDRIKTNGRRKGEYFFFAIHLILQLEYAPDNRALQ